MYQAKRNLGFADEQAADGWGWSDLGLIGMPATALEGSSPPVIMLPPTAADTSPSEAADSPITATLSVIQPVVPVTLNEVQLDAYTYGTTTVYGSNIVTAWRYSTGIGVAVALVDDGFDPATTATYGNFSLSLSRSYAGGLVTALSEPLGGSHGTTTSGLIGAGGTHNTPVGLAPNATIVGVKVSFGNTSLAGFAQAEQYAASVASVVNNSWGYTGYGVGEPNSLTFASWYTAIQWAVQSGRGGLGTIITFAAGNDRLAANSLAVQPIVADDRVIAVAATDANGTVATYSNPGSALLVAAIGNNVALANTGGSGNSTGSGTSYSSPTVAAIASLMLSVNPRLGWRDVQEILADAAYAPPPSTAGFTSNGGHAWNGGGMHFSNDLGFGVVDANVAVNLARAWSEQSTSGNMASVTVTHAAAFTIGIGATVASTAAETANIRVQHVQVTINDAYLPVADTKLVLVAPDGTRSVLLSQVGLVGGRDLTNGLDVSGDVLTSNAFWGENAVGTWTLQVQDIGGRQVGTIRNWSLTVIGDNAAMVASPLVYTPEFAGLAAASAARAVVSPAGATTIDLIALPGATAINLNGGIGMIDGVTVTVGTGLKNANADGSTGSVILTGLTAGGSTLSGGDGMTTITGAGGDTINGGLGSSIITTGKGGSLIYLSTVSASTATITSGGGDRIWAGLATATITATGSTGDQVSAQGATLTFINGSGASTVSTGTGTIIIQAGLGGGTYYAGTAGNSRLAAGSGLVTFYGQADGDVLTAAGSAADTLIAGAGTETLSGGQATGSITLIGGSGNDTMTAGLGRTTFVVGTGNDSITTGGIADIIQLRSGQSGGLDTISGFRLGIDTMHLIGFGTNAAATAIDTSVSDGHGGTLMNFADNTRIDLLGIARPTLSAFA